MNTPIFPKIANQDSKNDVVIVIEPINKNGLLNLKEILPYRDLLFTLALRDVKLRYRQTALGVVWVILQPLLAALIFSIIFSKIANIKTPVPYFVFAFVGFIAYNSFTSTLNKASMSMIQNSQMVSKVFFPRIILPLSTIYGTIIDFFVSLVVLIIFIAFNKIPITVTILSMPIWIICIQFLALGIGFFCASIMVSYRDVQYILPVLMQFGNYVTPVGFPLDYALGKLNPTLGLMLMSNPMSGLIDGVRWAILGIPVYSASHILICVLASIITFSFGWIYFNRQEAKFADVI